MIDKLKTESKRYSQIYGKSQEEKDAIDKMNRQIQIEKLNNVFKDNEEKNNNNENEKIDKQIYNLDFISKNIETFKNFSLIKNTIGIDKLELNYKNRNEKISSNKNLNIHKQKNSVDKKEIIYNQENENKDKNNLNNNRLSLVLDKTNNFNDDTFNVTQEQMHIFDNGVNQMYNNHKNNIKLKIFQINHPYLHNIKLINNNVESTSSSMTKEQRMLPILQKQKLILKKIQENIISRSNSSISKINNDSIEPSISNRDNKSDKIFSKRNTNKNKFELFPPYHKTLDNNIILDNYSSSDNGKNNSSEKNNIKLHRLINFKPYTLEQYKNKYENNNNKRIILGGLGPNLGGKEWDKKQKLYEWKKHYSDYIKSDNEFNFLKKKEIKSKNKKNEDSKTIISKKDYDFSSNESNYDNRYKVFKTENATINKSGLKLPIINQRFRSNNKIKLKRNKISRNNIYKINQEHDFEGSEKDLKQLIKQYEEYNENYKL